MVQYTRILISCILKINILWHFIWVDFSREEILRSEEPFFYLSIICHPRNGLWFSESFFVNIQKWKCLLDQHRTLLHCKILNICLWKCLRERFFKCSRSSYYALQNYSASYLFLKYTFCDFRLRLHICLGCTSKSDRQIKVGLIATPHH